jgi:hypothetical protein
MDGLAAVRNVWENEAGRGLQPADDEVEEMHATEDITDEDEEEENEEDHMLYSAGGVVEEAEDEDEDVDEDEDEQEDDEGGTDSGSEEDHPGGGNVWPLEGGRWTAARYDSIRNEPLYPGCKVTVQQQCYCLLRVKLDHHITDHCLDELCKYMHSTLLPAGNHHPPSLHLLKKMCHVKDVQSYEKHVCENDCCKFEDVQPSKYQEHANEKCVSCGVSRFTEKRQKGGGVVLVPRKVFWEISVEEAIKNMFGHPEWVKRRARARDMHELDFYKSEEAGRLDAATGGALRKLENSAYEIGCDWFQCFQFKQHSVGIVGMR